MSTLALFTAAAQDLPPTTSPAPSGESILLLGGLLLAFTAMGAVSVLARVLMAAIAAASAALTATFVALGRTLGAGLLGVVVLAVMVFGR